MKTNFAFGLATLSLAALLGGTMLAHAQQSGISRKDLLQENLSAPGRQVVQVSVGFGPGVSAARHSHPGEEVAYVLEGRIEYRIDGKPPVVLEKGDTVFIPGRRRALGAEPGRQRKRHGTGDLHRRARQAPGEARRLEALGHAHDRCASSGGSAGSAAAAALSIPGRGR